MLLEKFDFAKISVKAKEAQASPPAVMLKSLAKALELTGKNKKLSSSKKDMIINFPSIDIGVAIEVAGELRVAVVRDCSNKSTKDIAADIKRYADLGNKL